jgi:acetyl-CoA/propionyl-CoA carboxylase carboxyl transferase subunit
VDESLDPRHPLLRLRAFFDHDTIELLHERDRSGAAGSRDGQRPAHDRVAPTGR